MNSIGFNYKGSAVLSENPVIVDKGENDPDYIVKVRGFEKAIEHLREYLMSPKNNWREDKIQKELSANLKTIRERYFLPV